MSYFKFILFSLLVFGLCSCTRTYISLQEQWVDENYLASFHVKTPDPMLCNPPCGKNLLIEWNFPISVFREKLYIILTAILADDTTHVYKYNISSKRGNAARYFDYKNKDKRLLTYKIEVFNKDNKLVEKVENQFWVEEIIENDT